MSWKWRFVSLMVLALFAIFIVSAEIDSKVEDNVYKEIETKGEANVYVRFEDNVSNFISEDKIELNLGKEAYLKLSEEDIQNIEELEGVQSVELEEVKRVSLQDSVKIINSSKINYYGVNGANLTGKGQGICVLDTGVSYSHPDLGGCFGEGCKVVGGYDFVNNDANPTDDHGHGTHVAGIIAASGNITGVAPEANILALKVCNSLGACANQDISAGIIWCIGNKSNYNISIISMSLSGGENTTVCYGDQLESVVNLAISNNITVVAATGNNGYTNRIGSPACIENVTRAGATDKSDSIAGYSNRNYLVRLFAPGSSINSTWKNGDYQVRSGTSMATPHVSAAIALIKQFAYETSMDLTSEKIEDSLFYNGKNLYDSSNGINFSRIDVYNSIKNLSFGNLTMIPTDNYTAFNNVTFYCNVSSNLELSNITFIIWNSTSLENYYSLNVSGKSNQSSLFYEFTKNENYSWACIYSNSLFDFNSGNRSVAGVVYQMEINSPINDSYYNSTSFNISLNRNSNCSYSVDNSNYTDFEYSDGLNFSKTNLSLEEGNHLVRYFCTDGTNNLTSDRHFTVDRTSPDLNIISPVDNVDYNGDTNVHFIYNVSDNIGLSSCNLMIDGQNAASNSSVLGNESNQIDKTLSVGNYNWTINCYDLAGNYNSSESRRIIIKSVSQSSSVSSGGGGGGGSGGSSIQIKPSNKTIEQNNSISNDKAEEEESQIQEISNEEVSQSPSKGITGRSINEIASENKKAIVIGLIVLSVLTGLWFLMKK